MKTIDETGKRYGCLTVIQRSGSKGGKATFDCVCDCGKTISVAGQYLRNGHTWSCGCKGRGIKRHGQRGTKLYSIWSNMIERTSNNKRWNYDRYGGRGITVCDEWRWSFVPFRDWAISNGYEDGLSIERKDVNGNYCPENCTWIPLPDQAKNKTNTIWITHNGKTMRIFEWEKETGIPAKTIRTRIRDGWNDDDAVSIPYGARRPGIGRHHYLSLGGVSKPISEWVNETGIPFATIMSRLQRGWSEHDALTKPVSNLGRRIWNQRREQECQRKSN